ncbi:RE2 [Symbiodinium sp. KB8]|nr:RE2 [Symbiodinium sp. KB8]
MCKLVEWIDRCKPRLVILTCPPKVWSSQLKCIGGNSQAVRRQQRESKRHASFFQLSERVFERQIGRGDDALVESENRDTDQPMSPPLEDSDDDELLEDVPMGDAEGSMRSRLAYDGISFDIPVGGARQEVVEAAEWPAHHLCPLLAQLTGKQVSWAKNTLTREHGWSPVALVFGKEPRVFGELHSQGEPHSFHPRVGDEGSDVAKRMRYRYHAKIEYIRSQARHMLARTAHNRVRKMTNPQIGQLVFFWRAMRKKEPSRWVGPAYIVGLQGNNAWVAIGGRCFLVAGEHLREACGDEKHFGDPQIQKAIALFRKLPSDATYEDLTSQENPSEEPMEIEQQPLVQDVAGEAGDLLEGIDDLPESLRALSGQVGWTKDEFGNPVLVTYQAWSYRTPETRYDPHRVPFRSTWGRFDGEWFCLEKEVKWAELDNPHEYLPRAPAELLITRFQGRTRKEMCLEDVPVSIKKRKGERESVHHVHAVRHGGVVGKNKLKRMMEKEVPYEKIPMDERHLYAEAEAKEWGSWQQYESCEPPKQGLKGVKSSQILRLLKPVYGRPDAPRAWYEELARVLTTEMGFTKSNIDPAMFMLRDDNGSLVGCMVVHVDDLMVCHDGSDFAAGIVDKLGKRFPFGTWDNVAEKQSGVTYCGKEIRLIQHQGEESISLSQDGFVDGRLQEMEVLKDRRQDPESFATEEEKANFRSVVGSLQWLSTQSRPDLSFETNQLQKRIADLRVHDLLRANRAVKEVSRNRMQLVFKNLGRDAQLVVYTDAGLYSSVGVDIDEKEAEDILQSEKSKRLVYSQKGAVVGFVKRDATEMKGEESHLNVLDWRSTTNKRVIESSFAAETQAALMALGMGHFCQVLMSELRFGAEVIGSVEDDGWHDLVSMTVVTDCKSIYDTVHKDGQHISDKSSVVSAVLLRQLLSTRGAHSKARLLWVPTRHQLADGLTKGGRAKELRELLERGVTFREEAVKRKSSSQKEIGSSVNVVRVA